MKIGRKTREILRRLPDTTNLLIFFYFIATHQQKLEQCDNRSLPSPASAIESLTRELENSITNTTQTTTTISTAAIHPQQQQQQPVSTSISNVTPAPTTTIPTPAPINPSAEVKPIGGSLNRICHSLGNSSTSVNSKYNHNSPTNKSNSAPGRVR